MDKLAMPKDILAPRFPILPTTPVREFVKIDLPNPTSDFVTGNPKLWFSRDTPLTDVRVVLDRPIPSRDLVTRLIKEKCVGQFFLDGYCSFVDPRFNEGKDRFPFWVLTFFLLVHDVREVQDHWRNAIKFVEKILAKPTDGVNPGVCAAAEEVLKSLGNIGWNEKLGKSGELSSELATFLSAGWLKSSHIELQVLYLQERLQQQPVHGRRIGIASLAFTNRLVQSGISKEFDSKDLPTDDIMRKAEAHVLTNKLDEIYMPAHLSTQHWIVLAADFKAGTMRFGIELSGRTN
jgi:hypothetical protein